MTTKQPRTGLRRVGPERAHRSDRASGAEHRRLAELADDIARQVVSPSNERWAGEHATVRFEFVDLLDRHYVRLCRELGATSDPEVERALHELRVAHERLRHDDALHEARQLIERHIVRCPLTRDDGPSTN